MNFQSEQNKPVFMMRPLVLAANEGTLSGRSFQIKKAARADFSGDYMLKIAEARGVPPGLLVKVADATADELKDLVIQRLKADSDEKFEFLDGRVFSGAQAAEEVRKKSKVGDYFLELETETVRIVQEAFLNNKV